MHIVDVRTVRVSGIYAIVMMTITTMIIIMVTVKQLNGINGCSPHAFQYRVSYAYYCIQHECM